MIDNTYPPCPNEKCKANQVNRDIQKGFIKCFKCNTIVDFHYMTNEDEVRNFDDDEENQKVSRATMTRNLNMFIDEDDEIEIDGKKTTISNPDQKRKEQKEY